MKRRIGVQEILEAGGVWCTWEMFRENHPKISNMFPFNMIYKLHLKRKAEYAYFRRKQGNGRK